MNEAAGAEPDEPDQPAHDEDCREEEMQVSHGIVILILQNKDPPDFVIGFIQYWKKITGFQSSGRPCT